MIIFKLMGEIFFMVTSLSGIHNIGLVHYYTIVELIMILLIFNSMFKYLEIFVALIIFIAVLCAFLSTHQFNIITRVIESIFVSIISFIAYLKPNKLSHKFKYTEFDDIKAICIGLLLYYLTGVVVFYQMDVNNKNLQQIVEIHIYIGAICNIIYAVGIYHAHDVYRRLETFDYRQE